VYIDGVVLLLRLPGADLLCISEILFTIILFDSLCGGHMFSFHIWYFPLSLCNIHTFQFVALSCMPVLTHLPQLGVREITS
jgi:hypothetical protein